MLVFSRFYVLLSLGLGLGLGLRYELLDLSLILSYSCICVFVVCTLFLLHLDDDTQLPLALIQGRVTYVVWPPNNWRRVPSEVSKGRVLLKRFHRD